MKIMPDENQHAGQVSSHLNQITILHLMIMSFDIVSTNTKYLDLLYNYS